ncbi:MAG: alkaline phosphatase D family protein [Dehalococcoidia bacterium]
MRSPFPDGELVDAAEIGAVDAQSVRVWVRQPDKATVEARLEVEGRPPVTATTSLTDATDWTGAIHLRLPEPAPDRPFVCTVGASRLTGRLAPAAEARRGFAFGFGSCHRPYAATDDHITLRPVAGIYPAMVRDLRRHDARFVILGGDQVYSDELPPISVRDKLPGDAEHPPPLDVAVAAYRRVSRGFLGQAGFRALRESFPTYCIWDDHDIFNNWGSRLEKSSLDRRLFQAAARAYCEYQNQRNPEGGINPPPYHYTFRHGTAGFLVLDVRGARDYEHGQLLGAKQWADVQAYLHGPDAATVETLFVVSTIPIVHVARWMALLFDRAPGKGGDQVRDRWCSSAFIDSRDAVLGELFAWQAGAPTRQVIVLSGDIHAANGVTIRQRRGRGIIHQFTSSAFTSPHTPSQQILNMIAARGTNLFEPRFRFKRQFLAFANNFSVVQVNPLPGGGHRVTLTIRGWRSRSRTVSTAARLVCMPSNTR